MIFLFIRLLDDNILAVVVNKRFCNLSWIYIVVCHLDGIVAECEVLDAEEVQDTRVEHAECVVLDEDSSVISSLCVVKVRNTCSDCDAGRTPCRIAVVAVLEYVVADDHVTYTGLLEPEVSVTLEKNGSNALLLKRFSDVILKDMANQDLSVNDIADQLHMSRSILFKKIKAITGMTPNNFIKTMRLRKAAELLVQGRHKINEICWTVGFNTPSYFSKCFHKHFGMNPNEFAAKNRNMYNEESTEQ